MMEKNTDRNFPNEKAATGVKCGITGGIACGKTTVLKSLMEMGMQPLSADQIVAELYQTDESLIEQIVARYGSEMLNDQGGVQRRKLAESVFQSVEELDWLEARLHPRVRKRWIETLEAKPEQNWAVEIPLLFEKNLEPHFDYVLCISTYHLEQLERIQRKNWKKEWFYALNKRQWPLEKKMLHAQYVITNDGCLDSLHAQACLFADVILQ